MESTKGVSVRTCERDRESGGKQDGRSGMPPLGGLAPSISYRFIADNSRKSHKLAAMMPVPKCDNRKLITSGIYFM